MKSTMFYVLAVILLASVFGCSRCYEEIGIENGAHFVHIGKKNPFLYLTFHKYSNSDFCYWIDSTQSVLYVVHENYDSNIINTPPPSLSKYNLCNTEKMKSYDFLKTMYADTNGIYALTYEYDFKIEPFLEDCLIFSTDRSLYVFDKEGLTCKFDFTEAVNCEENNRTYLNIMPVSLTYTIAEDSLKINYEYLPYEKQKEDIWYRESFEYIYVAR